MAVGAPPFHVHTATPGERDVMPLSLQPEDTCMDGIKTVISAIYKYLTPEDDPLFWAVATYTLLGDLYLFLTREQQKHEIFIQMGACSHWLRPHQTRLTLAGGFALPVGYNGPAQNRPEQLENDWDFETLQEVSNEKKWNGLPEYDWDIKIHYNYEINDWVLTDKFFGKRKLICRFALPTRTLRHNQAAVHSIWTPGSPRNPNKKRTEYFGFRKLNNTWKCVFPFEV